MSLWLWESRRSWSPPDWLSHGARAVWIVDPERRTLTVCTPDGQTEVLTADETLDGGDFLPGFRFALSRLFADL